jgi:hypothetical protein
MFVQALLEDLRSTNLTILIGVGERGGSYAPRRTKALRTHQGASGIKFVKFVFRTASREGAVELTNRSRHTSSTSACRSLLGIT